MTDGKQNYKLATFAGGCFWCMVPPFEALDGVIEVSSGYTGGNVDKPTYGMVCSGGTGHYEAVQIVYDPAKISYEKLLDVFWRQIDPTDAGGQFFDRGSQYLTAVFYHDEEQKRIAESSRASLEASGKFDKPIATEILSISEFYQAEEYHQNFHLKNPEHYKMYKTGSGRESSLEKLWGKEGKSHDR